MHAFKEKLPTPENNQPVPINSRANKIFLINSTLIIEGVFVVLITLPGSGLDASGRLLLNQVASAIAAVFVGPLTYIGVTLLWFASLSEKSPSHTYLVVVSWLDTSPCIGMALMPPPQDS